MAVICEVTKKEIEIEEAEFIEEYWPRDTRSGPAFSGAEYKCPHCRDGLIRIGEMTTANPRFQGYPRETAYHFTLKGPFDKIA